MLREDMALEISMRRDIPMDEVEEVLEEQDKIICEEKKCKKKKKCMILTCTMIFFLLGAAAAVYILDKKQKIDMEKFIKTYTDKIAKKLDK